MKFIIFADVHVNESIPYSRKGHSRLEEEILPALKNVLVHARNEEADVIIHAGDFFDSIRVSPAEIDILRAFMLEIHHSGIKNMIAIAGNHEIDEAGDAVIHKVYKDLGLEAFKGHWYTTIRYSYGEQVTFHMVDFCHTLREFRLRLQTLVKAKERGKNILIAHQPVEGAWFKTTRSINGVPKRWFKKTGIIGKNFDFCVFGDFHKHQPLPYKKGVYVGNLTQNDFRDEDNPPHCLLIDTKDFSVETLSCDAPTFHTLRIIQGEEINYGKLQKGSYIRIILEGKKKFVGEFDKDKLKKKLVAKYKPKMILMAEPTIITSTRVPRRVMKRSVSDAELVSKVVKNNDTTVSDKVLYDCGTKYLQKARNLKK